MLLFFTLLFVIPLEFSAAIGQRCRGSEFKCFWDGSCISRYLLCDGMHDCPHGEDETEWFASCNHCKSMFHCHKDRNGPMCLDNDYVCDGFPDCINGEDESFEFAKCGCKRDLAAAELAGRVGCRKKCKKDSDCTKNKAKKKKSKCKDSKPCKNDEKDEKVEACICDYECGMSCVTISKTCPPLSPIPHQRSIRYVIRNRESKVVRESTKPYQYDTQAHYECNPGYEAYPTGIRMCHGRAKEKNSSWTNEVICTPSCDPKNNRLIKQFNLICGKTCVSNNECDGNETCTCDGACGRSCVNQAIDCGEAPSAPGAFIEYTGEKFKRVAHYICVEGTYLDGGDVARKCTGSGKWEGEPAICKPITCPDPLPSISRMGGSIVDYSPPPYYFNTTLEFVCDKGQRLLGSSIRTCMGNGRWSGIDTICDNIGELDRCPHPGIPIGGELMGSGRDTNFMIGQEVEFRCNNGLVLVGDAMQECLFYKRWSGEGVPTCVDPRYSDDSTDVIAKLSESTSNIKRNELIQAGKSVDMNSGGRIEVYFLIDLSSSMKDKHLGNLLDFAKGLVERISKNDTAKRLRFGIVVFATEPYEMLNVLDEPPKTPAQVLDKLEEIKIDYRKIRRKYTQYGTNIRSAITLLNQFQLANSYRIFDEDSVKRHIFTMTDGAHNAGGVPSIEKQNIERAYGENKPEFYSITSSAKDQSFEVREELRKLATNDKNFIYVEDFYKLHKYIDQVTDVREDYETCGKAGDIGSIKNLAVRGRSIGADNAVERAWPWQALITQYDEDLMAAFSDNFLRGGGSLINNKWVLTAAHLFYTYARGIGWEAAIMVTLGMTRRPYHAGAVEGSVKMFQPEKILIHEKYERYKGRRQLGTFQNDVALIKLGKEYILYGARIFVPEEGGIGSGFVEYTPYIRPVCLPCSTDSCVAEVLMKENSKGEILLSGEETPVETCKIEYDYLLGKNKEEMTAVVATGFGHNATRKPDDPEDYIQPSRHLLQAVLKVYERERCEEAVEIINKFSAFNHYIFTDEMFCALGTKDEIGRMTDTCQGDSGGPLVREVYDDSTKESCFVQVGIVSWGYGCGQFTHVNGQKFYYPGFYTDVTSMMSWINNKMKENE